MADRIKMKLNGQAIELAADTGETLLSALRREHLFGARESCGQGICGTCTVIVDERVVATCLMLAHQVEGAEVETIEGIGVSGQLNVVQQAFIDESGFQCGFCTPGMIVTVTQLLRENPTPTDEEILHYLSGNICRCGAYPEILKAVRVAVDRLAAGAGPL
jgi:aerobic-type carbon monoxide dehydrogenase small subunit (CoxS/CutS family)